MAPTPTPDDFLSGGNRRKEFSRDIGQDWNIRQVGEGLVGTYKPTGVDYLLAPNAQTIEPAIQHFTGSVVNGVAVVLTEYITQNSIVAINTIPFAYTMIVTASILTGGNGAANRAFYALRDETGANILFKPVVIDIATEWSQNHTIANDVQNLTLIGRKNYAANAVAGFRVAYKVSASNIFNETTVRVEFQRQ